MDDQKKTVPPTPENNPNEKDPNLEWEDYTVSSNGFYNSDDQLPDMVGGDSVKFIPAEKTPDPEDYEDMEDDS